MGILYDTFYLQTVTHPEKTALIGSSGQYTYGEISARAHQWAYFIHQTCDGRPRIALLTEDPLHTATTALAIAMMDGVCIPTNPQMLPQQLSDGWAATDVNMVIYEPKFAARVMACKKAGIKFVCTEDLFDCNPTLPTSFPWSDEKDYLITLSSGSTGAPKPIVISQDVKLKRAQQTWHLYNLTDEDICLCASPFFHSLGQRLTFVPLLLGATMVHIDTFTPKKWLKMVKNHRVSFVISVSSHLYALKKYLLDDVDQIRSLNTIVTSSAPIDANFKDELFQAVGCDFHEIYGATEIAVATNLYPHDAQTKYQTVGIPCDDIDVIIVDDTGEEVGPNTIGEIAVRSPLIFEEYYQRTDLTTAAMKDGYFLTGDLGNMDTDGFLSYVTRKKDVIISGGINIYPSDIENVISTHENIAETAVIGVDDDLLGEVIVCICVTNTDANPEADLRRLANKKLAPFQRPLKYFFVDELP